MDFPAEWIVFQAGEFGTAIPRDPGTNGMELFVQMRPNGRLLDHFRIGTSGSELYEAVVPLNNIIRSDTITDWMLRYQFWGRDINLRRNMTTSTWFDAYLGIKSGNILIYNKDDKHVPADVVLKHLDKIPDDTCKSAVLRVAAAVGLDGRMTMELQSLPMTKTAAEGKPTFNG